MVPHRSSTAPLWILKLTQIYNRLPHTFRTKFWKTLSRQILENKGIKHFVFAPSGCLSSSYQWFLLHSELPYSNTPSLGKLQRIVKTISKAIIKVTLNRFKISFLPRDIIKVCLSGTLESTTPCLKINHNKFKKCSQWAQPTKHG